jgi:hypothetical protein
VQRPWHELLVLNQRAFGVYSADLWRGEVVGGRNGCAVVEVVAGEGLDPAELPVFAPADRER